MSKSSNIKNKSKKRKRPSVTVIQEAVNEVINYGHSINSTAIAHNISKAYLSRIVKTAKESDDSYVHCPNVGNRRIFTLQQENDLVDYLKISSKIYNGLSSKQTRKLAFQYAETLSITPDKWKANKEASIDWLRGFRKRHKNLTEMTQVCKENENQIEKNNIHEIIKEKMTIKKRKKNVQNDFRCECLKSNESEYDKIAKAWAMELQKMSQEQQIYAKKAINDVLFEGQLGNLHWNSMQIDPLTISHISTPSSDFT